MDQDKQQNRQKRSQGESRAHPDDRTSAPRKPTLPGGTPNSGAGVGPGRGRDPLVHPGDEQDITPDVIAGQDQPSKGGASQRGGHARTDTTGHPGGREHDAPQDRENPKGDRQ